MRLHFQKLRLSFEHGMEWNERWNGTENLMWNMEDARME